SAGARAGFLVGDEISKIDGYDIGSVQEIATSSGLFEGKRRDRPLALSVRAESFVLRMEPVLTVVRERTMRVRIPSLLARYFERQAWVDIAAQLRRAEHVILDLRGNAGGSFPAMLRVASAFYCEETRLGTIFQPKNEPGGLETDLMDELSAQAQLEQLDGVARLHLRTFDSYPCFDGAVTVLVDGDTSSVAEILAESFLDRPRARVWGMPTAGQVVMAQWFPIYGLGGGDYSVSIPIAGYRTRSGLEMEDEGLAPERLLYYERADAIQGRDTWIETAFKDSRF
ncbi:MAG: S41 family peptidase, partial [Bdellovibrionaceae bacterium]|nr:S41 family peptidase [Pseudobdellovibrionaceae bacterium]